LPYAVHVDVHNRLYVIDQSERRVKVFDRDLKLIRLIGQCGRDIGQYSAPSDVCTHVDSSVFVCDAGTHRIMKYTEQGQFVVAWGGLGSEQGQLKCPACICLVDDNRLAVSDWGNDRIQVFTVDGTHLLSIGQRGKRPADFSRPLGIAFDAATRRLFVCDEGNNRVTIVADDWSTTETLHSKVGFRGPYAIVLFKDGRMIVSEHRAHRLQLF
jgi:tripartite motif-containing protein 71